MQTRDQKNGLPGAHPQQVAGMTSVPLTARGNDKEVEVRRDGVIVRAYRGPDVGWESRIPAEKLCGVELKPAGRFGIGYLLLGVAGADGACKGTRLDNIWDENTIYFNHDADRQFSAVRDAIEQLIRR